MEGHGKGLSRVGKALLNIYTCSFIYIILYYLSYIATVKFTILA